MPNSILFVCTGNTCRSPAAAALFASHLADAQLWWVASAGIRASRGAPPSAEVLALLAGRGLDLAQHRSKPLEDLPVEEFDLILVMERAQQREVQARYPGLAARRVYLVSEMSGAAGEVVDPFGQGSVGYQSMLEELDYLLGKGMAGILRHVGGRSKA